jgi:hypothetical protein
VDIIVSEDVMQRVKSEDIIFVEIDTVRVKGKEQKTVIYTAYKKESLTPLVRNSIESFKKAYSLYRIGNFFEALDLFNSIDEAFRLKSVYADRCLRFSVSPPANWEGVFDMDTK